MQEKEKRIIECDQCGAILEDIGAELQDRVIAEDEEGNAVTERFFDCPFCGRHYTVTVIDRQMRLMIQERQQIAKKVGRILRQNGNKIVMQKLMDKDAALKEELIYRASFLKEKYKEEQ